MPDFAGHLLKCLEDGTQSVNWRTDPRTRDLAKWIAMRENDRDVLKSLVNWDPRRKGRKYKVDTIPSKISVAFADFLYGEDPTILAANESNQERLDTIIEENAYPTGLHGAVDQATAEGESWFRIYVDADQQSTPIIEWHSRTLVVPYWRGKRLMAVAFLNELDRTESGIWRHVELHEEGHVYNFLYFSRNQEGETRTTGIGERKQLSAHPSTEDYPDDWAHDLPWMLAGRVPNKLGRDPSLGISDYSMVEDQIFDLNEAHTIDAENFRLAGKKRAVMPERFADKEGKVDSGEDILFANEDWDEMGTGSSDVFKILEYGYEGDASFARKDDLVGTILTRVGLARQFVDANASEGLASGTNLKTRLIPTTLSARGKSRNWDPASPHVLMLAQLVDALPEDNYGFNSSWTDPGDPPTVERSSVLPEDPNEKFERHVAAVNAGLESIETAVADLHRDWDENQVKDEVERIRLGLQPPEVGGDDE